KEGIAFFFLYLCFFTIICYDYHITCYFKNHLCFCRFGVEKKLLIGWACPLKHFFQMSFRAIFTLEKENKKLKEEAKTDDVVIACLLDRIESLKSDALKAEIRFTLFEIEKAREEIEVLCS
ncbi:hypothetical protein BD770DRAFT_378660, partial [Pilaira anomala]